GRRVRMNCSSCGAEVEEAADLCLECGEPIGESPAARVARQEQVAAPAANAHAPQGEKAAPAKAAPAKAATAAKAARRSNDEPQPVRCPACGIPSRAARCPGCGVPLRATEEV